MTLLAEIKSKTKYLPYVACDRLNLKKFRKTYWVVRDFVVKVKKVKIFGGKMEIISPNTGSLLHLCRVL